MALLARLARGTASLFAGLVVLLTLAFGALLAAGLRPVAVYSGSMVPTLRVGSLAAERQVRSSEVRVGDVVTFSDPYVPGRIVTHRVIQMRETKQGMAYRTKGDANPARDPWTIRLPARVGRVSFSVPYAGYALVYARTREVRTALILLSALSVLLALLKRIWRPAPQPAG